MIARCGYRCDLCPAYKENIHSPEDQQRVSDGWFKFYGFRIPPQEIQCDGCLADDSESPKRIDPSCPVRPCVLAKRIENCARCDDYPCRKIESRTVEYQTVTAEYGKPIPTEEYELFVKPYENSKVLADIRSGLRGN